ncbi:UDP-N-acetylglucosamine 1-carboxyvinyltransferase [Patescibacteria group bacterium]|nr:UDP-N-acetylglucosamine 1-carboxyvinyltransferase [Patescibacteria group bacterium]
MERFRITGGATLSGDVVVSGSKNAAASIIPATVLTDEDCVIHNMPKIDDVVCLLEILEKMGASVQWTDEHTVKINTANLDPSRLEHSLIEKIRMSVLLSGPLLVRFGRVSMTKPGGCSIGSRPISTHLSALEKLGALPVDSDDTIVLEAPKGLKGVDIVLQEISVTATENTCLAAARAQGTTTISLAAAEPHVYDCLTVLEKMGAQISGKGTHELSILGANTLSGFEHTLIADPIEVGTFLVAGALLGEVRVTNAAPEFMKRELLAFEDAGIPVTVEKSAITAKKPKKIRPLGAIQSLPYPGFPSDLLPPFALLMTQAEGTTMVHETLYEGRLRNYIPELQNMGANAVICDPHRALITGKTLLTGKTMMSFDLRAGATLILAALVAEGESVIDNIAQIDRGYENIDKKLTALGAHIVREENNS